MRLGTRWSVGAAAPTSLPPAVSLAVASVEAQLLAEGVDAAQWRWTLTWLEGEPVVELDDGTVIRYDAQNGTAAVMPSAPDDDAGEDRFNEGHAGPMALSDTDP